MEIHIIILTCNLKVRKPQPRHVQQRVDYLLKLMDKSTNGMRTQRAVPSGLPRKRKAPDDDQGKSAPIEEKVQLCGVRGLLALYTLHFFKKRREKEKEHSSHHKHHHHHSSQTKPVSATRDKTLADQLALVLIEKSIYGQALEDTNDRPFSGELFFFTLRLFK